MAWSKVRRWRSIQLRIDRISESKTAFTYLVPSIVLIFFTIIFPMIYAFIMSFMETSFVAGNLTYDFVWFANYLKLLSDPRIPTILANTIIFTVVSVLGTLIMAFAISLTIHHGAWGTWFFKRLFLIPWALSNVVNALMWQWMYSAQNGIFNEILLSIGVIDESIMWLNNEATALGALIIADIWKSTPFAALLILAALQSIPKELYDASKVDGAGAIAQFRNIVLPTIKPVLLVVLTIQTMWTLRVYDLIAVLTNGGPVDSTMVINVYAYNQAFRYQDIGYGSALAYVITFITLCITVLYVRVLGNENK